MARQNGIDLADVSGHGPGGIITREDLAADLDVAAAPGDDESDRETRAPVRGVQKHMADAMVRSVATAPQACVFLTVDATPTVELVDRLRRNRRFEGLHVTPLAIVARAVVLALPEHPSLNSSWDDVSDEVVTKRYVNLGIAVAGPRGLVVPNIKDAQDLTLRGLTSALGNLTATARRPVHGRRPARGDHHRHQRRGLRDGCRRAHPQSRGGRHPRGRGAAAAALGVRGRARLAPHRDPEPCLRPPAGRRAGGVTVPYATLGDVLADPANLVGPRLIRRTWAVPAGVSSGPLPLSAPGARVEVHVRA